MSTKNKVAILVIHGMGKSKIEEKDSNGNRFSGGMYSKLRQKMGAADFDEKIIWREVYWADILHKRQQDYIQDSLVGRARWMFLRKFVMHNLADAGSYRQSSSGNSDVYARIHGRVQKAVAGIERDHGETIPMVVLAHSLGGLIMSNYIYDLQKGAEVVPLASDFQRMQTMCGFITFGCNIPIFQFAFPRDVVAPIAFPGVQITSKKRIKTWWHNYNDKDDVLGMPLAGIGPKYEYLRANRQLYEDWINVGGFFNFWNPVSHTKYWTARQLINPVAGFLKDALKIGPEDIGPMGEGGADV